MSHVPASLSSWCLHSQIQIKQYFLYTFFLKVFSGLEIFCFASISSRDMFALTVQSERELPPHCSSATVYLFLSFSFSVIMSNSSTKLWYSSIMFSPLYCFCSSMLPQRKCSVLFFCFKRSQRNKSVSHGAHQRTKQKLMAEHVQCGQHSGGSNPDSTGAHSFIITLT